MTSVQIGAIQGIGEVKNGGLLGVAHAHGAYGKDKPVVLKQMFYNLAESMWFDRCYMVPNTSLRFS
jgi:hypothetical protein